MKPLRQCYTSSYLSLEPDDCYLSGKFLLEMPGLSCSSSVSIPVS